MTLGNLTETNKINIYYYALYALYAIVTLSIVGYGVFFLENLGFSYVEIGMTTAISAVISSVIQPLIGRLADIKQYSWKNILIVLTVIMLISALAIFFVPNNLIIFLFGLIVIVLGCIYPFLNAGIFYYEAHGIKTNFGVSRGFGSLSYTIAAAVVGYVLTKNNVMVINLVTVMASVVLLLVVCLLPYYGSTTAAAIKNKSKKFKNNVLFKYPVFTLIFISVSLFMIFHNIYMSYMISIFKNVGGGISDVAVANSVGALLEIPIMFLFYKLLERFSAKQLIIIASICYVVRALMIFFAKDPMGIYLSLILHMFTFGIIIPACVHLTDEVMAEEDKYEGQAFMGATLTIGVIFANIIGGNVLQFYDVNMLLVILVIITVLGCLFSMSTLLFKKNSGS